MSLLMDVLAGWEDGGRVRQLLQGAQIRSPCLDGWMTHTCGCIVLSAVVPYATAVTVDGRRMLCE